MHKKSVATLVLITLFFVVALFRPGQKIESIPPTAVYDTLSNSQLSYFARLGTGNTGGETTVRIGTSGNPSNTTSNLFVGDTVAISTGAVNGNNKYVVADIGNTATFQTETALAANNIAADLYVIATRSAVHTVRFTPQTNIAGGAWEFLIKATSRVGESASDGIPDQQGFDLGADVGSTNTGIGTRLKTADVTCPFGSAEVGSTAVVSGNVYHVIACNLAVGASNPIDTPVTITIGRDLTTGSQLINPSASVARPVANEGTADIYTFFIRHRDAADVVVDADTVQGKIAVVESVRVTATIDPTLTFTIDNTGVGSGASVCGNTLGSNAANTTATSVAFGSLAIGSYNDLAQRISCVTNSDSGYTVKVHEAHVLRNLTTGTTIPDTNCDGSCTVTVGAGWTGTVTQSEWGYSLENINANTAAFTYGGAGSFTAKAFGIGSTNAQTIISNANTPAATERAYVCYRLTASTTQEAGKYETQIVYTATATF